MTVATVLMPVENLYLLSSLKQLIPAKQFFNYCVFWPFFDIYAILSEKVLIMNANNKTIVDLEFNDDVKVSESFLLDSGLGAAMATGEISDLSIYEQDPQMPEFTVNGDLSVKEIFSRYIRPFAHMIDGSMVTLANGKQFLIAWNNRAQENLQDDNGLAFG